MFQRILVPVDLTDKNAAAIEQARQLVQPEGGKVIVLHVVETLDQPFDELEDFYRELETKARQQMARLTQPLAEAGLQVEQVICYGKRVPQIVQCARDYQADLLIITSHQLDPSQPGRPWMTISHQVAILAPCPVLMLR